MYDRKTWIVVIACLLLLALNMFYTQKDNLARAEQAAREKAQQAAVVGSAKEEGEAPQVGSLVEAPPQETRVEQEIVLRTPKAEFTFSNFGGGLKRAVLTDLSDGIEGPVTVNRHGTNPVGALAERVDRIEGTVYEFVESASEENKRVVFRGRLDSGLVATKTWTLVEGDVPGAPYLLDFKLHLENGRSESVMLEDYSLFLGAAAPVGANERPEQTGMVYRNEGSFEFTSATRFAGGWFSKAKPIITESSDRLDYAGVTNQFFATVVKPVEPGSSLVWGKVADVTLKAGEKPVKAIRAGMRLPGISLSSGESRGFDYRVFVGPKENRMLRKMGDEWGELMNYGMFSPFSRFMNWSLWWVHAAVDRISGKWSWGLAVVVLTVLLRLAIWPLYNKSNRTMKRMSKLKPEMDKIREKYPDDPNRMNQEMMKLYRTYGINPLGGCLPMFAQLPIFFGFYSMLLHAVELRGQSFLWVKDLAEPDTIATLAGIPINLLPILMAATSFLQMAMMPNTGGDKTQMMIIKLMPFFFLFICYNFASALALYWTASNVFSIAQTWITNRLPEPELKAKSGGGKSWVERMAERVEQQQKMRQAQGRVVDPGEEVKKRRPRTGG